MKESLSNVGTINSYLLKIITTVSRVTVHFKSVKQSLSFFEKIEHGQVTFHDQVIVWCVSLFSRRCHHCRI